MFKYLKTFGFNLAFIVAIPLIFSNGITPVTILLYLLAVSFIELWLSGVIVIPGHEASVRRLFTFMITFCINGLLVLSLGLVMPWIVSGYVIIKVLLVIALLSYGEYLSDRKVLSV